MGDDNRFGEPGRPWTAFEDTAFNAAFAAAMRDEQFTICTVAEQADSLYAQLCHNHQGWTRSLYGVRHRMAKSATYRALQELANVQDVEHRRQQLQEQLDNVIARRDEAIQRAAEANRVAEEDAALLAEIQLLLDAEKNKTLSLEAQLDQMKSAIIKRDQGYGAHLEKEAEEEMKRAMEKLRISNYLKGTNENNVDEVSVLRVLH